MGENAHLAEKMGCYVRLFTRICNDGWSNNNCIEILKYFYVTFLQHSEISSFLASEIMNDSFRTYLQKVNTKLK